MNKYGDLAIEPKKVSGKKTKKIEYLALARQESSDDEEK